MSKASAKSSSILLQRAWQELLKSATVATLFENGLGSGWLGLLLVNSPRLKALYCVVSDTSRKEARLDVLFEIASLVLMLVWESFKASVFYGLTFWLPGSNVSCCMETHPRLFCVGHSFLFSTGPWKNFLL